MKVALIQMYSSQNKNRNIARAIELTQRAVRQKAKFILLPEAFSYRGPAKNARAMAETIPGESTKPFMQLAYSHKVFILVGSVGEKIRVSRKIYNTTVLINNKGKIVARYRKMHLFDAVVNKKKLKEAYVLKAGRRPKIGRVGNFKMGLSICYDLRFPDLYRLYARKGATILCVPSCFTQKTGRAHWEALLRARAIENLCYVLAPNQIGKDARGIAAYGNSMIIDPWGNIVARASGNKEEIIFAVLDKNRLTEARRLLPSVLK